MDNGYRRTQSPIFGAVGKKTTNFVQDFVEKTVETYASQKTNLLYSEKHFCHFLSLS